MPLFYTAPGAKTGDVIPKFIDGSYQIFYLKHWLDTSSPDFVPGWHRMETADVIHMGPETPIHVRGGTGDLILHDGTWHLFSCIFPEGRQLITHYISRDGSLDNWELQEADTFGPDGELYDMRDWRDPRVIYRPGTDDFVMLTAARVKAGHSQTGCVGMCVSKDLRRWEYREPFYYPQRFSGACECPDYFQMGAWEYLVFSSYTTLFGVYYVKRPAGEAKWRIPDNHRLDGRAFYAAKTAGHGDERYIFGWDPTKDENIFGFWPDKLQAKDYRTWDWGGSLVVHAVRQLPNGDLALAMPESWRAAFTDIVENSFTPVTDGWDISGGRLTAITDDQQQMLLMQAMPKRCHITAKLRVEGARQAGLILRATEPMGEGYYLYIEPERGRLVYRSWLRMSEDGGKTFPYDVELETPVKTPEDGAYRLDIVVEDEVGTAYVNSEAALSFRMCDLTGGRLGLFSLGRTEFSDITMRT